MSLRTLRTLLVLVGIAFVGLTAWSLRFFAGVQPLAGLTEGYAQPGLGGIGLQATDVLVVGRAGGRRRWRMAARTVTFSRDRRSLTVDGIGNGLLYDGRGRAIISLTAGRAAYQTPFGALGFSTGADLRLDGRIRATALGPLQPTLETQSLVWDSSRNQISSPDPVTVTLPHLTVTAGNGAYAPPAGAAPTSSRGTLTLGGGVHALLKSPRGRTGLSCPGLIWDGAQGLARSVGPVSAQIPGGLGTATATDIQVDTKTGNLIGHGFRGTLALSDEVH